MRKSSVLSGQLVFIEPMQPTLVEKPPEGGKWTHEVKWDGYRSQIVLQNGSVQVFTRRGHDWTLRYAHIAADATQLPCKSAIIDGEVILADPAGASDFAGLQAVIASQPGRLTFVAFDLLHLDGIDLRSHMLVERRALLAELIGQGTDRVQYSQQMPGSGVEVFGVAERAGLEGIVSKRLLSRYKSRRTRDWLKIKSFEEAEFELLGVKRERERLYTPLTESRRQGAPQFGHSSDAGQFTKSRRH